MSNLLSLIHRFLIVGVKVRIFVAKISTMGLSQNNETAALLDIFIP